MQAKHVLNYASIMAFFGMAFHKNGKSDEHWHPHAVLSLETAMFAYKPVPTLQKC